MKNPSHLFIFFLLLLNSVSSQTIVQESDKILKAYIRSDQNQISYLLTSYGFKEEDKNNLSTARGESIIFSFSKIKKTGTEINIERVQLSKYETHNKNTELEILIVQFPNEKSYLDVYNVNKEYIKSKIDKRIYSRCENLANRKELKLNTDYCYQEHEAVSENSTSYNFYLDDPSYALNESDFTMIQGNVIKGIYKPGIGLISTHLKVIFTNLNCDNLPETYKSYQQASRYITNTIFKYKDSTDKLSSWITEASYYSCDGYTGYFVFRTADRYYIHKDLPLVIWIDYKNSPSLGQYYNETIWGKYQLVIN